VQPLVTIRADLFHGDPRRAVVEGISIRSIRREHGDEALLSAILYLLIRVDELADGRRSGSELAAMARAITDDFPNISIETMAIALRRGVGREKMYGKLTYAHLTSWISAHIEDMLHQNDNDHMTVNGRR
jgi:hypothetical protein